jgi:hypothetical protein
MARLGEGVTCVSCRREVFWDQQGRGALRLMERRGLVERRHICRPLCDAWMPHARERCARFAGHSTSVRFPDHRTRYAMDCAARNRRKWLPARSIGAVA